MSDKFKHRQTKVPSKRNAIVKDMIANTKGGPMRHRSDRRPKDARRNNRITDDLIDMLEQEWEGQES